MNQRIALSDLLEERGVNPDDHLGKSTPGTFSFPGDRTFVSLIDANHCPGSVCFLFEIEKRDENDMSTRFRILHTGDFRCSERFLAHPLLSSYRVNHPTAQTLDLVYLDTTYSDPQYRFPCQKLILEALSAWTYRILVSENRRRLVPFQYLLVIGRYMVGKERIYLKLLGTFPKAKVYYHPPFQHDILNAFQWDASFYRERLELKDPRNAMIHVVPMSWCDDEEKLSDILLQVKPTFTHMIAIKPTGWTFKGQEGMCEPTSSLIRHGSPSKNRNLAAMYPLPLASRLSMIPFKMLNAAQERVSKKDRIFSLALPYSEHSSYHELVTFCRTFNIAKWLPTVRLLSNALYRDTRAPNNA
jgi:DNA cross-link repair 1A protein